MKADLTEHARVQIDDALAYFKRACPIVEHTRELTEGEVEAAAGVICPELICASAVCDDCRPGQYARDIARAALQAARSQRVKEIQGATP
jgi:hypothetical protein